MKKFLASALAFCMCFFMISCDYTLDSQNDLDRNMPYYSEESLEETDATTSTSDTISTAGNSSMHNTEDFSTSENTSTSMGTSSSVTSASTSQDSTVSKTTTSETDKTTTTSKTTTTIKTTTTSKTTTTVKTTTVTTTKGNSITVPDESETVGNLVWVPTNGGKKYHAYAGCSNMIDPIQVSVETAVANGYTPCGRCHP